MGEEEEIRVEEKIDNNLNNAKGFLWKLPVFKTKELGKLGPAFGLGVGCGVGFGVGFLGAGIRIGHFRKCPIVLPIRIGTDTRTSICATQIQRDRGQAAETRISSPSNGQIECLSILQRLDIFIFGTYRS
ncbi:uncharacterized protein LOC113347369 isoform X1 [Papaver somniferum]|uniref:uncharacterized protein LOC113347369 isoform X1 n=1 Tax=Papaver somniferum TaxID=3469 RepID=UPI000E701B2B|nr:uncharacterized protein LOC113347369 isoform X1 [Papaver somniferum]